VYQLVADVGAARQMCLSICAKSIAVVPPLCYTTICCSAALEHGLVGLNIISHGRVQAGAC